MKRQWSEHAREYFRVYARARYRRLRAAGSCLGCGIESTRGTVHCTECGVRRSKWQREYARRVRAEQRATGTSRVDKTEE